MNNESIVISMDLPNKILSPNYHPFSGGGRFGVMAATKKQRKQAKERVEEQQLESIPREEVTIKATFYHTTNRKRDGVNFNQRYKAAQDGITDAGVVNDDTSDHVKNLPPDFKKDKDWPRMELEIVRVR